MGSLENFALNSESFGNEQMLSLSLTEKTTLGAMLDNNLNLTQLHKASSCSSYSAPISDLIEKPAKNDYTFFFENNNKELNYNLITNYFPSINNNFVSEQSFNHLSSLSSNNIKSYYSSEGIDPLTGNSVNTELVNTSLKDELTGISIDLQSKIEILTEEIKHKETQKKLSSFRQTQSVDLSEPKFSSSLNTTFGFFDLPPVMTVQLVNDTAPFSATNTDKITYDPSIGVTVSNPQQFTEFRAGFNSTPTTKYINVLPYLQPNGVLTFDQTLLKTIYGNTIPDGYHTLRIAANSTDGRYNTAYAVSFPFILDTTPPIKPSFSLDVVSDSGEIGDRITKFDTVTLVGQTEASRTVVLDPTGRTTTADSTGQFTFTNVHLAVGDNFFTARAVDIAGNENTFSTAIKRINDITISLTNNIVAENSQEKTVIGQFYPNDSNTGNSYIYTLLDDAMGRFQIVGNELQVANGTLLDFESNTQHSIIVKSTDASGLSLTKVFNINITNVNEAPSFTTTLTRTTIESGSTFIYNILTTDPDAPDTRVINASGIPSWLTLIDNGDGSAILQGTPDENQLGLFNFMLTVQDAGELKTTQEIILRTQTRLTEGNNFAETRSLPVLIPVNPSILTFKINPNFDTSDTKSINDAVEVALVDATGKSLVHTVAGSRDAFFNWTEGEAISLGAGATYNPADGTVSLNLTGIGAGTNATLVFRLVNNDSDTTTSVSITDFAINPAPIGTQPPVQGSTSAISNTNTAQAVNFNLLTDVSQSLNAEYHRTSFNADTRLLYADIAIRNIGSYSVDAPLIVAVNRISDPTILVRNPDGFMPDGIPYYNLGQLVGDRKLDPNELIPERSLVFYNPQEVQFTYDLVVLAQLNQAPVIQTQANKEIIAGKSYSYDVDATDPNGDALTYRLLVSPDGMIIDPTTGLINWNTTTTNIGNHLVSVEVNDGRGGVTQQNYTVTVIDTPPNRPPLFTSTPVVDTAINTPYLYQANALDADNDLLIYSLLSGPQGMTVDANTGVVSWTPNGTQLRTYEIKLVVTDGKGGTAQQGFKVRTQAEPGNHAPLIISDSMNKAYTSNIYTYDVNALDPDNDSLTYSLVQAPGGMIIDANTGMITWSKPLVGQQDITVQVQDSRGGVDVQKFNLQINTGTKLGEIKGTTWEDLDNDGVKDSQEKGLSSVQVYLDINKNGIFDNNEPTTQTNEQGEYKFTDLSSGTYIVREVLPNGFVYTSPQPTPLFSSNLLQNGSFELGPKTNDFAVVGAGSSAIPYWNVTVGSVDYVIKSYWQASDGNISIDLTGTPDNGGLSQTFNTIPGKNYLVTFDLSTNPSINAGQGVPMLVKAAGQSTTLIGISSGNYQDMKYKTSKWQFTATSATTTIEFISQSPFFARGPAIDQVSVVEIISENDFKQVINLAAGETASNINFGNSRINQPVVNNQPTFTSSNPRATAIVGELWQYDAAATDLDKDVLTYELIAKPDGMTVDPTTGIVAWKPTLEQSRGNLVELGFFDTSGGEKPGVYDTVLAVRDGKDGIHLQTFTVQVVAPNTAPTFTNFPVNQLQAAVNYPIEYQFKAQDAEGNSITFSLDTSAPSGATINPITGVLSWKPTAVGDSTFKIIASDNKGAITSQNVTIAVSASTVNANPVIGSQPRKSIALGQTYVYAVQASDSNYDPLTYSLETAPQGMTIDTSGIIFWQPQANHLGSQQVKLNVSDGRGGITPQSFDINVVSAAYHTNNAPTIISAPSLITNLERTYEYNLTGSDPDGDLLLWSLDSAPEGMVIDSRSGALRWQPSSTQVGEHTVAVRLTDAYGLYVAQEFTLTVTGVNTPPQIVSAPITRAAQNQAYTYNVVATDSENDQLTFALGRQPAGMTIDDNGIIRWTPQSNQIGQQEVEVLVQDAQGAVSSQVYTVEVGTTAINTAPSITSTPVYVANTGSAYNYQVQATDPDAGDRLTYQLLSAPTGMIIDAATGLLTWTNPVAGNYRVVVGAVDAGGLGAAQGFNLTARANNAPVIRSTPVLTATPGSAYGYDIIASDVDGDRLTYSLDQASRDKGITLDTLGRLRWNPDVSNVGTHRIVLTVSDGSTSTPQQYDLVVAADKEAPKVRLIANYDQVNLGETIIFQARATDNVKVAGIEFWINDTPVVLDANGIARYKPTGVGRVIGKAIATDTANNSSVPVTFEVQVRDPNDVNAPSVSFNLSGITDGFVTASTKINANISDPDSNLDYYRLLVAPVAGGEFRQLWRNDNPANSVNGELPDQYKFDPSLLQNDSYIVRLEVGDNGGNVSYSEQVVDVAGELKLGNFRLSFTDLTVPVTGIPISLTRTYDTLTSGITDDFGYGWRLEFRDTDLRTSLRSPSEEEQLLGYQSAFKDGTRVYVTLPGGKREAFTFRPTVDPIFALASALGGVSSTVYKPAFVGDKGVTSTLMVKSARILRKDGTDEYVGLNGGINYNPADVNFGNVYLLTTKEGIVYEIDAQTGDLLTVTDTNGNKLTYTDEGIYSSTGKQVTFERDAQGRITSVKDPMGELIRYTYDAKGDLVSVTDREGNTTRMEYNQERSHYLDKIIDPLNRTGIRNEYGDDGRLKEIVDVNGQKVEISYDQNNYKQVVKDARGYSTTYIYDSRGNVLQEIDAKGGIVTRTYDDDNNLLSETDADGVTTKYTYDSRRNLLTMEDEDGNVTRMTYNSRGQATTIVSPTGLSTSAEYDSRGNLIESIDTDGLKSTYTYNEKGQLRFQTAPDGQVTEFDYDRFGNINRMVDSRGNEVKADYDLNGRIDKATTSFILNGQTYSQWMDYDYDDNGRTIASRTSQGNSQSMIYDALGRVSSMTDVFGNVTSFRYDLQGVSGQSNTLTTPGSVITRIDEMTLPDNTPNDSSDNPKVIKKYDQNNNLIAEVSPTGLETRYIYDELGRIVETIIPDLTPDNWDDNPRIKTEYSAASRIKSQIDVFGNKEEYSYNNLGQLVLYRDVLKNETTYSYTKGGQIETVTDPRLRITRYVYDDKARFKEAIFFDNSRYQVTYDQLGRIKTETNELNQTTSYEYDAFSQVKAVNNALNQRTEFEYDQRKNLVKVTDALGHSTRYKYDEYAQQVETIFENGDKVSMGYDQFGRVTSVTDENLNTTKYTYDNLSQLTQVEQANQAKTKYTYSNLGLLTQTQDANQNVTKYEYDDFYRLTATILPMGQRNQTVYDKFGQVTNETDFNGDTINYGYDQYGRLQQKTFTDPRIAKVSYTYDSVTSQLKTVTDGRGVTQYNYDQRDRLSEIIQPDQQFVRYGYDLLDNVTSLTTKAGTTSYGYDKLNRLDTVKDGTRLLADYDYDAVGNLIQTKLANGSVESRQYDTRDRLTQVTTKNVTGTIFSDFKYTLDAVGNRKRVEEYSGRSVDYTYDSLYRLTEEKITDAAAGNRTIGYSYDLAGNRLTKTDSSEGITTYSYDANNRLKNLTQGNIVTNFTYDNNGSLKQRTDGSQTVNYEWVNDGENRLIGVTSYSASGTSQQQYIYDAFGSRVASISDGVRTNYLAAPIWDLPEVLMEYDSSGQITADYTQGIGLVRSRRDGREGFYHTDGLGSTRLITDNVGLITDRYTYDAFGELLNQTGTFGNSFQFAGEQRDAATGLDYLRARYYDSSLGRFISKDAFPGYLQDPYSQHDYQYAHGNPVRYTDPTGYFTLEEVLAGIQFGATLAGVGAASGGVGAGLGYIAGAAATGASGEEILGMFGEWGAGFASGVSGGFLTDVYSYTTGQKIEPKHAFLYNAGNVTGIGVSFLVGMKAATWAKTAIGPLKWVSRIDDALDAYDAAKSTYNLYQSYQDNGKFEREDAWNLLAYVPFAGALLGSKKFFAANKAINNATESTDNLLKRTETSLTSTGNCFVAGTEILTTEGIKNIEDIKVGDWVIADDPTTPGEIEARQVTDTFIRQTTALVDLYIDGEVISTTGEHPLWTPDKGWVEAKDLQVGSLLQTEDGRVIDVDKVEKREGQFQVYNFSVEEFHTYYVSELGILVHNARKDIYFGDGVKADSDVFHKDIKPNILSKAGKFQGKVGKNPDIKVVSGKIVLTGTGQFKGKSFKTDLSASDFFGKSDIPDVSDTPDVPDLLDE